FTGRHHADGELQPHRRGEGRDAGFLAGALRYNPHWLRVLRLAKEYRVLPTRYLGMRRDAYLDFLLTMALDVHDNDLLCPCGCGFYADDTLDPDSDGWYGVDDSVICSARAANTEYQKNDAQDAEPGTLITVVDERKTEAQRQKLPADRYTRPAATGPKDEALG